MNLQSTRAMLVHIMCTGPMDSTAADVNSTQRLNSKRLWGLR